MIPGQEPQYILVNSISQIDPNKLSLSQLGTKYMDRHGNRYAVRFNKDSRKAEIVRITLQKASEALPPQRPRPKSGKVSQPLDLEKLSVLLKSTKQQNTEWIDALVEKAKEAKAIPPAPANAEGIPTREVEMATSAIDFSETASKTSPANFDKFDLSKIDLNIMESKSIPASENEDVPFFIEPSDGNAGRETKFIEDTLAGFLRIKERIESVLNNIRNSKIFEATGDPSENKNIIGNLNREYDLEFFQKLDKILNYHKELTSFPRSITYYVAKYESGRKQALQSRSGDHEKLQLVIRWEMQEMLLSLTKKLKKMMLDTLNVLNTKNDNHLKQIAYNQQQMFKDARNALLYCSEDVGALLISLQKWVDSEG
ncbi:hypothetical protein LEP1GSC047_1934 [Leptospira inadai serovar Lyme str. 10]|uniref:Uncharacterized protein n=2 Tax=Leptospira inadai serovar Lyme TaxID=293084 RepID=V6H8E1_9LEPT|nr:hypothetical protein [Leptospira inadai]EQA34972.1 hypothetical protein LEP1GSC047_1934 [Leptospira inadai serovar Lyme str. 10]PNV74564.1 hypothetical protein BES34_012545 [Leptospira inadai serovar Lyme]